FRDGRTNDRLCVGFLTGVVLLGLEHGIVIKSNGVGYYDFVHRHLLSVFLPRPAARLIFGLLFLAFAVVSGQPQCPPLPARESGLVPILRRGKDCPKRCSSSLSLSFTLSTSAGR